MLCLPAGAPRAWRMHIAEEHGRVREGDFGLLRVSAEGGLQPWGGRGTEKEHEKDVGRERKRETKTKLEKSGRSNRCVKAPSSFSYYYYYSSITIIITVIFSGFERWTCPRFSHALASSAFLLLFARDAFSDAHIITDWLHSSSCFHVSFSPVFYS